MTDAAAPTLTPAQQTALANAQVLQAIAAAQQATTAAATNALSLAQAQYKALVPDLTNVATNAINDKSTGVAFSGVGVYAALEHAAEMLVSDISAAIAGRNRSLADKRMLVTSNSDILTNDLLTQAVQTSLAQLHDLAGKVLSAQLPTDEAATDEASNDAGHADTSNGEPEKKPAEGSEPAERMVGLVASPDALGNVAAAAGSVIAAGGAVGAFGPLGIAAAAAAGVPSIISLFSSTTSMSDATTQLADGAAVVAAVSALLARCPTLETVHDSFRLRPRFSQIADSFDSLSQQRLELYRKQYEVQTAKDLADMELADDPSAGKTAGTSGHPAEDTQAAAATRASADAGALLTLISSTMAAIDAFTTAAQASAQGARSPLATAILNESLRRTPGSAETNEAHADGDRFDYLLSVSALGGQSEEFLKDRHVGADTYTTMSDASISYLMFDVVDQRIVCAGVCNGVTTIHGTVGQPPTGFIGSSLAEESAPGSTQGPPESHDPALTPRRRRWRWIPWFS